jgi:ribosomal protein S17E
LQGRVRTKTVKRAARVIIEKYYQKMTLDFDTNKRVVDEVAIIQSKRCVPQPRVRAPSRPRSCLGV